MYQKIKKYIKPRLETRAPKLLALIEKYKTIIKYIISGGTAAVVQLGLLYVLTDIVGLWYIISSSIAFVVALLTSFFLQKFWTFRDDNIGRMKKQFAIYTAIGIVNFILNPTLLYIVVDFLNVWYLLGQVIVSAVLAISSYLINKFITFKKVKTEEIIQEHNYESVDDKHRQ